MKQLNEGVGEILKRLEKIENLLSSENSVEISDFISEFEARKRFSRGTTWFWSLRKSGFPYTKLGGQVYYKKKDLIDYLENNKKGGGE